MNNTLIVFASNHGTVEKSVRELFRHMNGKVDICDLNNRDIAPDLSRYDSVIIGGSIHYGKIQTVISVFSKENKDILLTKRLGLFVNCLYSGERAEKQLEQAFPSELYEKAIVREYFGGEVNNLKLNFWERFITKHIIDNESLVVAVSKDKIVEFAEKFSLENEVKS